MFASRGWPVAFSSPAAPVLNPQLVGGQEV
jgi:hypothetical protein